MAVQTSRFNLSASQFPLLSELQGRTVIVGTHDQNYTPGQSLNPGADVGEVGIPQLFYAHNVLPTPQGYQSIGYFPFALAQGTSFDFIYVFTIRDSAANIGTMGVTATGQIYLLQYGTNTWVAIVSPPGLAGARPTTAYVRGVTYIYFAFVGCYVYNFTTFTMVPTVLTAINTALTLGIVGSNGYLACYDATSTVAWSSVISATDFTPSLSTGAGGGNVEGLTGRIITAVSIDGGIIIFSTNNAVAMIYQANSRYPFAFNAVANSGGLSNAANASYQALDSDHAYVYSTSGLQALDMNKAQFLLPAATEFLSGSRFEDFDETTNLLSITTLTTVLKKQIAFIADRFVVISYGINSLTHAIVIDVVLNRVGKLKVDHIAIFEFQLYDQTIYETPKKSIGVMANDGTIKLVNTDIGSTTSTGVMILGKYQYVRPRLMTLQGVDIENIPDTANFNLYDLPSLDGKTFQPAVAGYNIGNTGLAQHYNFFNTASNHSLLFKGRFNAVSGEISYNIAGKTGLA
jgi:hypothetical protein